MLELWEDKLESYYLLISFVQYKFNFITNVGIFFFTKTKKINVSETPCSEKDFTKLTQTVNLVLF